jgi:hypothetical protein
MLHNLRQMVMGGLVAEEKGQKSWGGKREGAGRKPIGAARMVAVTVTLPADLIEKLEQLGEGNLSAGIREAVRQFDERSGR